MDPALFVKGSADRYRDVPDDVRQRLAAWVVDDLKTSRFPLAARYPDLAKAARPDA